MVFFRNGCPVAEVDQNTLSCLLFHKYQQKSTSVLRKIFFSLVLLDPVKNLLRQQIRCFFLRIFEKRISFCLDHPADRLTCQLCTLHTFPASGRPVCKHDRKNFSVLQTAYIILIFFSQHLMILSCFCESVNFQCSSPFYFPPSKFLFFDYSKYKRS